MKSIYKIISLLIISVVTLMISACSSSKEENNVVDIVYNPQCVSSPDVDVDVDGDVCSLEAVASTQQKTYYPLGKETVKTIKKLDIDISNLRWVVDDPNGKFVTDSSMMPRLGLTPCENNACTDQANPTGYDFSGEGEFDVSITGTVTVDGKEIPVDKTATVNVSTTADSCFTFSNGEITDYKSSEEGCGTEVNIPYTINGEIVETIGFRAFGSDSLTSVTIPSSVTSIGRLAFYDNILTSVTIPDSVTTIESGAFIENSLTSVTIPDSVTTIGSGAFRANSLTSLTIGSSVTDIEASAFRNNNLTSVTIPSNVTAIGSGAFSDNGASSNALIPALIPSSKALNPRSYGQPSWDFYGWSGVTGY